jgi:ABC-type amino acid transport system permease subunit
MFDTALSWSDLLFLAQGAAHDPCGHGCVCNGWNHARHFFGGHRISLGAIWSAPLTFVLDVFRSVPLLIQLVLGNALQSIETWLAAFHHILRRACPSILQPIVRKSSAAASVPFQRRHAARPARSA